MQEIKSLEWNFNTDEVFIDYHCGYVQSDFITKIMNTNKGFKKTPPPTG